MTIKGFCILMAIVAILGLSCSVGLQGGNGIEVVGNSTDNSVTMSLDGTVVRGVLTDSGNATGSDNWLSMLGSGNVTISASGSTITISCDSGGSGGGNATYALDSDKLDGQHGSYYLSTTGTAADSTLFYGFTALQWTSAMDAIAAAATSADSDKLDGLHGSSYLLGNATAVDSDKLDGLHGSSYLLGNATAADSDKLDGQHGSYYAVSGGGVTGVVAGTGISVSANTGNVTITTTAPGSAVYAYLTTPHNVTNTTWTKVLLDTESYDILNEFDKTTNHRFVATTAGLYLILGQISINRLVDQTKVYVGIWKNGTELQSSQTWMCITAPLYSIAQSQIASIVSLAANDYLELWVWQSTGFTVALDTIVPTGRNYFIVRGI